MASARLSSAASAPVNHPGSAVVVGPGKVAGQPLLRGSTQHLVLLEVWEEFYCSSVPAEFLKYALI